MQGPLTLKRCKNGLSLSLEKVMRRKIYQTLLEWKKERKGEVALLIEGARRIGKSYIVEEFGRKEYDSYILVDFSKAARK